MSNSEGSDGLFEDFVDKKPGEESKEQEESDEDGEDDVFDDMFNRATNFAKEDSDESIKGSKKRKQTVCAHRGTFVGTPHYVSPEMLTKNTSGPFIDIWALGVIVYQILSGELPWKGLEY